MSAIIGIGAQNGVIATRLLSGDVKTQGRAKKAAKRRRGTNRNDFCRFLRRSMFPAMLESAAASGLNNGELLYLVMDNASIHKGAPVEELLELPQFDRIRIVYQPPYMPNVHPTEWVNALLKRKLKRADPCCAVKSTTELKRRIETTLNGISVDAVRGYYKHCGWW